jgi:hypothetical protein
MTDEELMKRLRELRNNQYADPSTAPEFVFLDPDLPPSEWEKQYSMDVVYVRADRIEALTAENARLRDAVYIDDLTVTLQGEDRAAAIEGIGRALDLLRADMVDEAKASLRATLAKMKGEKG